MNDHNDSNNSSKWWMILCVLLLVILLLVGGKLFSAGYLWPILIVGFILVHFWMMLRGHRSQDHEHGDVEQKSSDTNPDGTAQSTHEEHKDDKPKHHGGGCCH